MRSRLTKFKAAGAASGAFEEAAHIHQRMAAFWAELAIGFKIDQAAIKRIETIGGF